MKENKLVPKRRFKEFENSGDWELRKLGEVVSVCSGRDYKHLLEGEIPVYGTGGYMLSVNEALSYNDDAIGIGRKGTINKPYILRAPFWTVDTLFYTIPNANYDLNFIYNIFQNINWKQKDESTGVPSLSKTAINNIDIWAPEYNEQIKIGNFFTNLDNLITLHQRKLNKLKETKSAYLSEMFPKEGEKYPKRRFAGFTEAWELRKLSDFADKAVDNRGKTPPLDSNGTHPLIEVASLGTGSPDYSKIEKFLNDYSFEHHLRDYIKKGDILFSTVGSIGLVSLMDDRENAAIAQNIVAFRAKENYSPEYLYALFSTESSKIKAYRIVMGAVQPSIKVSQLVDVKYYVTNNKEEQKKIGAFFSKLDNLITLHQRKLEKLQNIKKAYLNEMFV